jgi:hypothetical protein
LIASLKRTFSRVDTEMNAADACSVGGTGRRWRIQWQPFTAEEAENLTMELYILTAPLNFYRRASRNDRRSYGFQI